MESEREWQILISLWFTLELEFDLIFHFWLKFYIYLKNYDKIINQHNIKFIHIWLIRQKCII